MKNYLYSLTIEVLRQIVAFLRPDRSEHFEQVHQNAMNEVSTAKPEIDITAVEEVGKTVYFNAAVDEIVAYLQSLSFEEQFKLYEQGGEIANLLTADETFAAILKVKNYLDGEKSAFKRFIEEGTNGFKSLVRTEKETFTEFSQTAEKNVRDLVGKAETHANTAYTSQQEAAKSEKNSKQYADDMEIAKNSATTAVTLTNKRLNTIWTLFWIAITIFIIASIVVVYNVKSPNVTVNDSEIRKAMKNNETFQNLIKIEVERQIKNLPPAQQKEAPVIKKENPLDETSKEKGEIPIPKDDKKPEKKIQTPSNPLDE